MIFYQVSIRLEYSCYKLIVCYLLKSIIVFSIILYKGRAFIYLLKKIPLFGLRKWSCVFFLSINPHSWCIVILRYLKLWQLNRMDIDIYFHTKIVLCIFQTRVHCKIYPNWFKANEHVKPYVERKPKPICQLNCIDK